MFFPAGMQRSNPRVHFRKKTPGSPLTPLTSRLAVIITFCVGAVLLIDQQLETVFDASPIIEIDRASRQVTTEAGTFLAEHQHKGGPSMHKGELLVLEMSPITKTVVAYKPYEDLLVHEPRENIFSYWVITLAMALLSLFLIIRWNHMNHHFELLVLNLILLVIITILYLISH